MARWKRLKEVVKDGFTDRDAVPNDRFINEGSWAVNQDL